MKQMLAQGNNLRLRDEGGRRGRSNTQDQKTKTISTCWINPGGLSLIKPLLHAPLLENAEFCGQHFGHI